MEHTSEYHQTSLDKLCRICGRINSSNKRSKNYEKPRLCESIASDIMLIFGLDIKNDDPDKHSKWICVKCAFMVRMIKKRQSTGSLKNARQLYEAATPVWSSFSAANSSAECTTCRHRVQLASGCLPRFSLTEKTALVLSAETSQTQDTLEGNTTDTLNTTATDTNNAQTSQTRHNRRQHNRHAKHNSN